MILTKDSRLLIDKFVEDTNINEFIRNKYLKKVYDFLKDVQYKNSKIKYKNIEGKVFPESRFLPNSLQKKINKKDNILYFSWKTINNKMKSVNCNLYLYIDQNEKIPDTELLIKIISYIVSFTNKNRKFMIHIAPLNDKKYIKRNQQRFMPYNINSGSCKYDEKTAEILIWRKEELIKTIIHECLHGLNISHITDDKDISSKYCKKYKIQLNSLLLDESYVELWAKILNCYIISELTNSDKQYQHFYTMLALEKEFTFYQSNKIHSIIKKYKNKKNILLNLDEFTNITSYYLIINFIFHNLEELLMICNCNIYLNFNKIILFKEFLMNIKKKTKVSLSAKS